MPAPERDAPKVSQNILGRDTCQALRKDISETITPSWLGRVPPKVGSGKKHGKLSADQRKVLFMVHFVITLIPRWTQAGGVFADLLENWLTLVEAIHLASSRTISEESIQHFEATIQRYTRRMAQLLPFTKITPTLHVATRHFGELLRDFGPSIDWHGGVFERQNHLCMQVRSNNIPGRCEVVFLVYM